jgi:hypothetical protein
MARKGRPKAEPHPEVSPPDGGAPLPVPPSLIRLLLRLAELEL